MLNKVMKVFLPGFFIFSAAAFAEVKAIATFDKPLRIAYEYEQFLHFRECNAVTATGNFLSSSNERGLAIAGIHATKIEWKYDSQSDWARVVVTYSGPDNKEIPNNEWSRAFEWKTNGRPDQYPKCP